MASLVNLDMWQWKILIYLINILVAGERLQDGMSTRLSRPRVLPHEGVLAVGGIKTQPKLQADALWHGEYVPGDCSQRRLSWGSYILFVLGASYFCVNLPLVLYDVMCIVILVLVLMF